MALNGWAPPKTAGPPRIFEYSIDYSEVQLPVLARRACQPHHPISSLRVEDTTSCGQILADTQGEIPYSLSQKKPLLITYSRLRQSHAFTLLNPVGDALSFGISNSATPMRICKY
jgi:hypothetical protein